jgi:hypothetical protein
MSQARKRRFIDIHPALPGEKGAADYLTFFGQVMRPDGDSP